jgi:hypothetical protein
MIAEQSVHKKQPAHQIPNAGAGGSGKSGQAHGTRVKATRNVPADDPAFARLRKGEQALILCKDDILVINHPSVDGLYLGEKMGMGESGWFPIDAVILLPTSVAASRPPVALGSSSLSCDSEVGVVAFDGRELDAAYPGRRASIASSNPVIIIMSEDEEEQTDVEPSVGENDSEEVSVSAFQDRVSVAKAAAGLHEELGDSMAAAQMPKEISIDMTLQQEKDDQSRQQSPSGTSDEDDEKKADTLEPEQELGKKAASSCIAEVTPSSAATTSKVPIDEVAGSAPVVSAHYHGEYFLRYKDTASYREWLWHEATGAVFWADKLEEEGWTKFFDDNGKRVWWWKEATQEHFFEASHQDLTWLSTEINAVVAR